MLCQIGDALLGENKGWLESDDVVTDFFDVVFFELEDSGEVGFVRQLHVCLTLSLERGLVGKRALEVGTFWYSREQSKRRIRGFSILRFIFG